MIADDECLGSRNDGLTRPLILGKVIESIRIFFSAVPTFSRKTSQHLLTPGRARSHCHAYKSQRQMRASINRDDLQLT